MAAIPMRASVTPARRRTPMNDGSNQSGPLPSRRGVSLFGKASEARSPSEPAQPQRRRRRRRGRDASVARHAACRSSARFLSFVLIGAFIGLAGFVCACCRGAQARPARRGQGRRDRRARTTAGRSPISWSAPASSTARCCSSSWLMLDGSRGELKRGEYTFKAGISMREVEASARRRQGAAAQVHRFPRG